MSDKELMEKAEARCLELVNDGSAHAEYSKVFEQDLLIFGVEILRKAVASLLDGDIPTYFRANVNGGRRGSWNALSTTCKFGYYNKNYVSVHFTRMVFGLVLEHWLSSNAPTKDQKPSEKKLKAGDKAIQTEPVPKVGDLVSIKAATSVFGYEVTPAESQGIVADSGMIDGRAVCFVDKRYYYSEDLQVIARPSAPSDEATPSETPHHLDRVIAEQKAYYTVPIEQCRKAIEDAVFNSNIFIKEPVMLKIETKTFVNGAEISKLEVDQLVHLIATSEAEIAKLKALNSKPKKVLAKIEELEAGLKQLVEEADKA